MVCELFKIWLLLRQEGTALGRRGAQTVSTRFEFDSAPLRFAQQSPNALTYIE
jgi:hypothetical protein